MLKICFTFSMRSKYPSLPQIDKIIKYCLAKKKKKLCWRNPTTLKIPPTL